MRLRVGDCSLFREVWAESSLPGTLVAERASQSDRCGKWHCSIISRCPGKDPLSVCETCRLLESLRSRDHCTGHDTQGQDCPCQILDVVFRTFPQMIDQRRVRCRLCGVWHRRVCSGCKVCSWDSIFLYKHFDAISDRKTHSERYRYIRVIAGHKLRLVVSNAVQLDQLHVLLFQVVSIQNENMTVSRNCMSSLPCHGHG